MKKTLITLLAMAGVAMGYENVNLGFDGSIDSPFSWTYAQDGTTSPAYANSDLEGYGKAITFDKSCWVSTGSGNTDYNFTVGANGTNFSIVTTVLFDEFYTTGDTQQYICGTGTNNANGIAFTMDQGKLGITTKGKAHNMVDDMTALETGTWYTLAVTYAAETGAANFYVNGENVGTLTLKETTVSDSLGGFSIGSASVAQQGTWAGAMADFQLFINLAAINQTFLSSSSA